MEALRLRVKDTEFERCELTVRQGKGDKDRITTLAANKINRKLSNGFKLGTADYEVHEIVPVKFGGSPTDLANKVGLPESVHTRVTTWFGRLQRLLEGR